MKQHWGDCNIYKAYIKDIQDDGGVCDCGYGRHRFTYDPEKKHEPGIYYSKERLNGETK